MDFATWLASWVRKHPLKTSHVDRRDFTEAVMQRIQTADRPRRVWNLSLVWPRLTVPAIAACAVALLIVTVQPGFQTARQVARAPRLQTLNQITRELNVLASLDPAALESINPDDDQAMLETADETELLMFAEDNVASKDTQWLEQTMQLLEQFDADVPDDDTGSASDEDWIKDLQLLDEADLAAKL